MFVCFSRQPAGRFTPKFACGRTLVPYVSSPLLWVSGPRRTEKGGNENFVTMKVSGEFLHFCGFCAISQQRVDGWIHTKFYLCRDNVCRRASSPCGVHRPLGAGGGGVKNSKDWGWSHPCIGQLPFLFFSALPNCGSICRAQTCAHSDVEPSRSAKAFLQGGPNS